jgi:hypothetical protein
MWATLKADGTFERHETTPAHPTEPDVADLMRELKSRGYDLVVRQRRWRRDPD